MVAIRAQIDRVGGTRKARGQIRTWARNCRPGQPGYRARRDPLRIGVRSSGNMCACGARLVSMTAEQAPTLSVNHFLKLVHSGVANRRRSTQSAHGPVENIRSFVAKGSAHRISAACGRIVVAFALVETRAPRTRDTGPMPADGR